MIYKCDKCKDGPCYKDMVICQYFEGQRDWQPTDEYEIIKKPTPPKSEEEFQATTRVINFKTEEARNDFMEKRIDPVLSNQTPNCSICEWKETEEYKAIIKQLNRPSHVCAAQAWKPCSNCYDNENCKSLFSPKENKCSPGEEQDRSETKLMRH